MPKKILCAVDGSDASDRAAACAVELAKETGAKLTFVHVNSVQQDRIAKRWFWDETLLSAMNAEIQSRLANGQKIAANHGLADFSSVVLKSNRVSSAITSYAKEKEFDYIVMGTGVTNDMERLFLGSVATEVVSGAHCPVTIVR
ncbi:universal stress protein [Mesorhizobium sophorae]|uniref:universal stress protein n=1 Tax=Mesorhizobium sophorae TaxID=1300294 RepID=UPI000BA3FD6E|nr:universal stress protein [Mesorhizobium sophorae]